MFRAYGSGRLGCLGCLGVQCGVLGVGCRGSILTLCRKKSSKQLKNEVWTKMRKKSEMEFRAYNSNPPLDSSTATILTSRMMVPRLPMDWQIGSGFCCQHLQTLPPLKIRAHQNENNQPCLPKTKLCATKWYPIHSNPLLGKSTTQLWFHMIACATNFFKKTSAIRPNGYAGSPCSPPSKKFLVSQNKGFFFDTHRHEMRHL